VGFTPRERAEAVEVYRSLGLDVFPYDTRSVPFIGWNNPALWTPAHRELVDRVHTIGVRLDEHHAVVDVDANRGGDLAKLEHEFGPLPPTLTAVTPGGPDNLHLVFRSSVPLRTCKQLKEQHPGVDFLAAGSHFKGATSVRYLNTGEEVAYKLQHPILEPSPLPAALELEWSRLAPATEGDVWNELIAEGLDGHQREKLTRKESTNIRDRIKAALRKIREAPDGGRHDPTFRAARDIYRAAVLLGEPMERYDPAIEEAYKDSGGSDFKDLHRSIRSVKVWVAQHPIHRPRGSAYHALKNREIGEWADAAISDVGDRDKTMQQLIAAVASEATTAMNMTTAGELLAGKYPGCGNQKRVSVNLGRLVADGWLIRDGEGFTSLGFGVPHWKLENGKRLRLS
jgi:Bifunctional DNA primase/polymerase, N-terminal